MSLTSGSHVYLMSHPSYLHCLCAAAIGVFSAQLTGAPGIPPGSAKLGLESHLGGALADQRGTLFLQIPFPIRPSGEEMWGHTPPERLMIAMELLP